MCQTNACRAIHLPTAVIRLCKVQARSRDRNLSVPEMGMCPGKSRQSWKRAKPQRGVRGRSQDAIISPWNTLPSNGKREKKSKTDQTKHNRRVCKPSRSTLVLCNRHEEGQCRTSGFNKGGSLSSQWTTSPTVKDCLSTAGPLKTFAKEVPSGGMDVYNPTSSAHVDSGYHFIQVTSTSTFLHTG